MERGGSVCARRWLAAGVAALALAWGCSGGGGGGGSNEVTQTFDMPVASKVKDVPLNTGVARDFVGTYHTPQVPNPLALTALTVDVGATLASAGLTKTGTRKAASPWGFGAPGGGPDADVIVRVAPAADAATVCSTGIQYGPYAVTLAGGTVDPPDPVEADPATLSIVNTGAVALCVRVIPKVDATLNLARVALKATTCEAEASDLAGDWTGTYACDNSPGCGDEGGTVDLTITQDGHSAHYSDGTADYDGTVCGGVFRFNGAGPGYTEDGVFTLRADGTATKTSTWRDFPAGFCSGSCRDSLHRVN